MWIRRLAIFTMIAGGLSGCSEGLDGGSQVRRSTCLEDLSSGLNSVMCGDFAYDISIPPRCTDGGCGLIVDVHGATMDAVQEDNNSDMQALGGAAGYIVVQPSAPSSIGGSRWLDGDGDEVTEVAREIADRLDADTNRIHLMGFSNGGQLTWEVWCTGEDFYASIAPAAAARGEDCEVLFGAIDIGGCLPTDEGKTIAPGVDVLYMAGREDSLVKYSCSETQRDSVVRAIGASAPSVVMQSETVEWQRYQGDDGTVFEIVTHDYTAGNPVLKGHCYPGSTDDGEAEGQLFSFACEQEAEFHWGQVVLDFFKAHPRTP